MKKLISSLMIIGAVILAAFFLASCGKQNQNNDNNNTVNQAAVCPAGYYLYYNQCYPQNPVGPVAPLPPVQTSTNGFYADNYSGTSVIRITNGPLMKEFFKNGMGTCDRAAINGGQATCDSYVGGSMDIIIQFMPGNIAIVTFIAQPTYNPYLNYQYSLPSGYGVLGLALGYATGLYLPDPKAYYGAYKNPLQLQMQVSAINNSQGFKLHGYGDYYTAYNRTVLAIEVPQGKLEDSSFNFNFLISGNAAAQGTLTRCRTQNCGL